MTLLLTAALLATLPVDDGVARDAVETIEVNHFFDDEARPVFTQAIFFDADDSCRDWRLVKNLAGQERNIEVRRDYRTGEYSATWLDGDVLREVRAKCWRETFTQHDVELVARDKLPTCNRKLLSSGKEWRP